MYILGFLLLMIFGIAQEWALTGRVYDWLAHDNGPNVALVQIVLSFLLSAFLGMQLFRRVGIQLLQKAQRQLVAGTVPDRTLAEGLLLIAAAMLLILPGYLSDALGTVILILRQPLAGVLLRLFKRNLASGKIHVKTWSSQPHRPRDPQAERLGDTLVIDVEPLEPKA